MAARRHGKRSVAQAHLAKRDRGQSKDTWDLRGTVSWPVMGDGTPWTAAIRRVTHAATIGEGSMEDPKLVDDIWMATVTWDPVPTDPETVVSCHPLDNLLPA